MEGPNKFGEKNPDNIPVSKEELATLGIGKGISMTRGELNRHIETQSRKATVPTESIAEKMSREVTKEEIDRAEEAGKKQQEMGK